MNGLPEAAIRTMTLADFPAEMLTTLIRALEEKYPITQVRRPSDIATDIQRAELLYKAGQRSVIDDLRAALSRQENT